MDSHTGVFVILVILVVFTEYKVSLPHFDLNKVNKTDFTVENSSISTWPIQNISTYYQHCRIHISKPKFYTLSEYITARKQSWHNKVILGQNSGLYVCLPPKSGVTNWHWLIAGISKRLRPDVVKTFVHNVYESWPGFMEYRRLLEEKLKGTYNLTGIGSRDLRSLKLKNDRNWEKDAKGVILVRHPLTRLYSSWSNRFYKTHAKYYPEKIKFIKEHFEIENINPPEGMAVTFLGFLKFVTSDEMWGHTRLQNGHWMPISTLCDVCNIKYDYIINQEDATRQTQQFLIENDLEEFGPLGSHQTSDMNRSGQMISQDFSVMDRFRKIQDKYKNHRYVEAVTVTPPRGESRVTRHSKNLIW